VTYLLKITNFFYPLTFSVLANGEDLGILACTVFDWSTCVTDGRTDGWTELRWLRHAKAVAAFAHKNENQWYLHQDLFYILFPAI